MGLWPPSARPKAAFGHTLANVMSSNLLRNRLLCAAFAVLAVACGGGGGGGGGATVATDLLIKDATVDGLLSFTVKVQSLQLVDSATGALTADVLDEDVAIELIGAGAAPRWVSRAQLPVGAYRGVQAGLDVSATVARNLSGALVAVTPTAASFTTNFATPLTVAAGSAGSFPQIVLDIDLAASLTGDAATPPIVFTPVGILTAQATGALPIGIDEVEGVVRAVNGATDFVVDAFADDDRVVALGRIKVTPSPTALLVDPNGQTYASAAAFFAALTPDLASVEVHGSLVNGGILASRIEVEHAAGGVAYVVKLEGVALDVDTAANTFDLVVVEVEKGAVVANPLLASLGNTIACDYDAAARFLLDENVPTTEAGFVSGQRIKAKFAVFAGAPFRAVVVEIEGQPEFEGVITNVAGLPNSLVMRLEPGNAALGGSVASTTTDVTVDLSGSTLRLDTAGAPALATAQLKVGQRLEVRGAISGPNTAPTIAASRTEVHAGRASGVVTSVSPGTGQFTFTIASVDDPFGGTVTAGPATATVNASCVFGDEADDAASFYALFANLGAGQSLEVEVHGLGLSLANHVEAYEVEAKVD
jgi:hypothetical protein